MPDKKLRSKCWLLIVWLSVQEVLWADEPRGNVVTPRGYANAVELSGWDTAGPILLDAQGNRIQDARRWSRGSTAPPTEGLLLRDGSEIYGVMEQWDAQSITVRGNTLGKQLFSQADVVAMGFTLPRDPTARDALWQTAERFTGTYDRLLKYDGTWLTGTLKPNEAEQVWVRGEPWKLEVGGKNVSIDATEVVAVVPSPALRANSALVNERDWQLFLADGSKLSGTGFNAQGQFALLLGQAVTLPKGAASRVPWDRVSGFIKQPQGPLWVTSKAPLRAVHRPLITDALVWESKIFADDAAAGMRVLEMRPTSQAIYLVPEGSTALCGSVVIDLRGETSTEMHHASLRFQILAGRDSQSLTSRWQSDATNTATPANQEAFRIELDGARLIVLVVEAAAPRAISARGLWCDLRFD